MKKITSSGFLIFLALIMTLLSTMGFIYIEAIHAAGESVLSAYRICGTSTNQELRILEINKDGKKLDLNTLVLPEGIVITHDQLLWTEGTQPLLIRAAKESHLQIIFLTNPLSGAVRIENSGSVIEQDLTSQTSGSWTFEPKEKTVPFVQTVRVRFASAGSPKAVYGLYFFLCGMLLAGCLFTIRKLIAAMKAGSFSGSRAALFALCVFLLFFSSLFAAIELFSIVAILLILLALLFVIYRLKDQFKERIQYLFLIFASVIGCLMLLLIPPTHILDEYAHFIKAYQTSFWGDTSHLSYNENKPGETSIYLPESMRSIEEVYQINIYNPEFRASAKDYLAGYAQPLQQNELKQDSWWISNTINQPLLAYLPDAALLFAMRLLNLSPILMFHLGRFVNLLIWILICYKTIEIVPRFKRIFLIVMLLPITIEQSFGFNVDWLTNAMAFLLTALLLREIYRKGRTITWIDAAKISAAGILLALCKLGYFPLAFLAFLIPNSRFKSKKAEVLCKMLIMIPICMVSVFQFMVAEPNQPYYILNHVNIVQQPFYTLDFIAQHPMQTAKIYVATLVGQGVQLYHNGLLTGFGWYLKYPSELIHIILGSMYLIFVLSNQEDDEYVSPRPFKAVHFAIFALISFFIFTSLFLTWTPQGYQTIIGLQPRYFIPCMIPLYIVVQNRSLQAKYRNANSTAASFLFFSLGISILTIAFGYYV